MQRRLVRATLPAVLSLAFALGGAALAWPAHADEIQVEVLGPQGEDLSNPVMADDHIVAVLSYEKTETTQLCGAPMGRTLMKITVHADGAYNGVETSSRLHCSGSGLVRKAQYSKHEGKLTMTELAKLWDRLGEITGASQKDLADNRVARDTASVANGGSIAKASAFGRESGSHLNSSSAVPVVGEGDAGGYRVGIQRADDIRGVLSERDLPEFVQSGQAAVASAQFMQAFILEGKIN